MVELASVANMPPPSDKDCVVLLPAALLVESPDNIDAVRTWQTHHTRLGVVGGSAQVLQQLVAVAGIYVAIHVLVEYNEAMLASHKTFSSDPGFQSTPDTTSYLRGYKHCLTCLTRTLVCLTYLCLGSLNSGHMVLGRLFFRVSLITEVPMDEPISCPVAATKSLDLSFFVSCTNLTLDVPDGANSSIVNLTHQTMQRGYALAKTMMRKDSSSSPLWDGSIYCQVTAHRGSDGNVPLTFRTETLQKSSSPRFVVGIVLPAADLSPSDTVEFQLLSTQVDFRAKQATVELATTGLVPLRLLFDAAAQSGQLSLPFIQQLQGGQSSATDGTSVDEADHSAVRPEPLQPTNMLELVWPHVVSAATMAPFVQTHRTLYRWPQQHQSATTFFDERVAESWLCATLPQQLLAQSRDDITHQIMAWQAVRARAALAECLFDDVASGLAHGCDAVQVAVHRARGLHLGNAPPPLTSSDSVTATLRTSMFALAKSVKSSAISKLRTNSTNENIHAYCELQWCDPPMMNPSTIGRTNTILNNPEPRWRPDLPSVKLRSRIVDDSVFEFYRPRNDSMQGPLALLPMLVPSTTFIDKHIAALIEHKATLDNLIAISQQWVTEAKSTRFKSSHDKKSSSLQHIPTNLHVSWLHHWSTSPCTCSTLSTVSCGIPAAHALGLDTDLVQLNDLLTDLAEDCVALHASMSAADRASFGVSGLSNGYDESVEASPATSLPPDVAPRAMASRLNSLYSSAKRNLPPVPSAFKSATSLGDNHHQTAPSPLTSLWARALQLEATHQLRKTMVVAQALTALTAAFQSAIVMTMQQGPVVWADRLALWQRVGFLCGWESLVSSQGKELHMLHDAQVGILACQQFQFQLVPSNTDDVAVCGKIVQVPVDGLDVGGGDPIPIVCVLFTQGINEMQSLANMSAHLGGMPPTHYV
ncbi:hypothetical protein B5M09_010631 [Aphanomyces astaci]|uniref:C2 domain-containing protein n=1 Tax=Aphanomyces astaci TaxID=112090 RepID=A0A425CTQ6_APHAT|nr:hypothetical protein B5M09_010631 [Aphanomyces astaci]